MRIGRRRCMIIAWACCCRGNARVIMYLTLQTLHLVVYAAQARLSDHIYGGYYVTYIIAQFLHGRKVRVVHPFHLALLVHDLIGKGTEAVVVDERVEVLAIEGIDRCGKLLRNVHEPHVLPDNSTV